MNGQDVRPQMPTTALAAAYLALMPVAWPVLPLNVHVADLLFPFLAFAVFRTHGAGWRARPLDYCVLGYVLALVPSILVSDDLRASGIELVKRIYVVLVYVVFAMYFQAEGYRAAFRVTVWATIALCSVGVAGALVYFIAGIEIPALIVTTSSMPYLGPVIRLRSGTETGAMLGNYLTFALPFLYTAGSAAIVKRSRAIVAIALSVVTLAWSFSHPLPGFMASAVVIAWPALRGRHRHALRLAAASAVLLCVLAVNLVLMWTVRRVEWTRDVDPSVSAATAHPYELQSSAGARRLNVHVSYNPMSYYLLKRAAFTAFLERPWTGVGLGQFHLAAEQAFDAGQLHESYRGSDPHSTLFGTLAETGIPGGVAIALLMIVALAAVPRSSDPLARSFVFASRAALIGLAVNSLNVDSLNFRFLWVALAGTGAGHSRDAA